MASEFRELFRVDTEKPDDRSVACCEHLAVRRPFQAVRTILRLMRAYYLAGARVVDHDFTRHRSDSGGQQLPFRVPIKADQSVLGVEHIDSLARLHIP